MSENENMSQAPEIGESDERDDQEQHLDSEPSKHVSEFKRPADDPELLSAPTSLPSSVGSAHIQIINRALPNEGVPGCRIVIGGLSGTTNAHGNANIELSSLPEGEYAASFLAPDVSDAPMGPAFPPNTSRSRIWRPLVGRVVIQTGRVVSASPSEWLVVSGATLTVRLQPAWMRSPLFGIRPGPPDMIVIHHTAGSLQGDLDTFLNGNRVSIHYLIAPSGEVYKLVHENNTASHAGVSHWQGLDGMNSKSIGIEMTHISGEYPPAQVDALIDLVKKLQAAFPGIPSNRVIAHSDIGICDPSAKNPCTPSAPRRLGRKSGDPSSAFPWERVEALGLSLQILEGMVNANMFGGYFKLRPTGKLRSGDRDEMHRYGGEILTTVNGAIAQLQTNLQQIGYYCPPDGAFGSVTGRALQMFQQHMFSGTRRTSPQNSGDGTLDLASAELIKRVVGEVTAIPTA